MKLSLSFRSLYRYKPPLFQTALRPLYIDRWFEFIPMLFLQCGNVFRNNYLIYIWYKDLKLKLSFIKLFEHALFRTVLRPSLSR